MHNPSTLRHAWNQQEMLYSLDVLGVGSGTLFDDVADSEASIGLLAPDLQYVLGCRGTLGVGKECV